MEQLTMRNSDGTYSQPTHTTFEKMFYKLAFLEDLMEKYHCNDIVDLENMLQENTELKKKLENKQKFKKGQKVCFFDEYDNKVYSEWGTFIMTESKTAIVDCRYGMFEISLDDIFATVTEAEQRLKELKGE